ncbi:MAG: amidohydrolase family protein [Pseudomonadota bacterium]
MRAWRRLDRTALNTSRRKFLALSGALALGAGAFAASRYWPEQGLFNPCRAKLPEALARHELVRAAWEGLNPGSVWDGHCHLLGNGDSGSGIYLNPAMASVLDPVQYAQRLFYMNASCADAAPGRVDRTYVERMQILLDDMRPGAKLLLFAFDASVTEAGEVSWERTGFYVPNAYAAAVAERHAQYFEWAASVHPYRRDCVERLEAAARRGARAIKWLPAAMGMDPASKLCDRFFEALSRHDLPLITHAGLERAVQGTDAQELGNPLRLRRALDHGVRVVVAHCASMGQDRDIDRGAHGPATDSFALFARMMDEPRYFGRVYGDISAVTQSSRAGVALASVIQREDWHARLLNGSDYPLPGVFPLYSLDYLVGLGYIEQSAAPLFKRLREHNPLLFDFVLKRSLRAGGKRLAGGIFETRAFFDRRTAAGTVSSAWRGVGRHK